MWTLCSIVWMTCTVLWHVYLTIRTFVWISWSFACIAYACCVDHMVAIWESFVVVELQCCTYLHIIHDRSELGTIFKQPVHSHSIVYSRKVSFFCGRPPTTCLSPTNKLTWLGWHGRVQHQSSQRLIVFSMMPPCLIWLVWMPNFCVKTRGEIHISPIFYHLSFLSICVFHKTSRVLHQIHVFCIKHHVITQKSAKNDLHSGETQSNSKKQSGEHWKELVFLHNIWNSSLQIIGVHSNVFYLFLSMFFFFVFVHKQCTDLI